jgi:hypothetical protein
MPMFERTFYYTHQAALDDVARAMSLLNTQAEGRGDTTRNVDLHKMTAAEYHFNMSIERQGRVIPYTTAHAEGRIVEEKPGHVTVDGFVGINGWMILLLIASIVGLFLYMLSLAAKDPKYPTVLYGFFLLAIGGGFGLFLYYEQMKTLRGIHAAMSIVPRVAQQRAKAEAARNARFGAISDAGSTDDASRANAHLKKW